MREILTLIRRFRNDERGVFAVIFAIFAIVLVATAGAVVDFTTIEQARTRAQDALDSAALGLQPTIFEAGVTEDTIRPLAQALLTERLSNVSVTAVIDDVEISTADGTLALTASLTIPTAFVALVGVDEVSATLVSEATRKRLAIEIAMVLDNSGSMAQESRMTELKKATRCAINILYNAITECSTATVTATLPLAPTENNVKIGIVPFNHFVNVGTGYANAVWMDTTGISPISNDNFDDDNDETTPFDGPVNRFDLFADIDSSWGGCVEARPYPYDTNDEIPNDDNPATLFVPEFAPDEPGDANDDDDYENSYLDDTPDACPGAPRWRFRQVKTQCSSNGSNNKPHNHNAACNAGTVLTNTITETSEYGVVTTTTNSTPTTTPVTSNPPSLLGNAAECTNSWTSSGSSPHRTNTYTRTCSYPYSDRELQERLCKYTEDIDAGGNTLGGHKQACPSSSNAITPLTTTKADVVQGITDMSSNGFTNIHQGTIWGFHMLSPTEPLTEGSAYETGTYKVMIVMTDGENTVNGYDSGNMNSAVGYMVYGYPGAPAENEDDPSYNGRIYSSAFPRPESDEEVTKSIDERLVQTCANAKAAGITIFTIGLATDDTSDQERVETMLETCSNGEGYYFFPEDSDDLTDVFKTIASQLADLRLAR